MPTAVLIANPSASQFTGGGFRQVKSVLERVYSLSTEWPIDPEETRAATGRAAGRGVDVVFAMGGDGVAHHVANGLVGTDSALGIIPVGTTNVLSRILGIPQKALKAAEAAIEWQPVPTRTVRVDAVTDGGELSRHATFSLGFGFDADVVDRAESRPHAKTRFGMIHYASTAVGRLVSTWRTEQPHLRLTCDGERFDAVVALTQVHNPYTYFGPVPLHLAPDAPEGVATLAGNDLHLLRAAEIVSRATLRRNHRSGTGVKLFTDYRILVIEADPATPFQADGEMLGWAHTATITPVEDALLVIRPHDGR
jgi:diacylglycerol kinase family enzyme